MKKYIPTIFILSFIIFILSSPGHTPYNHFTLFADALLHGKLYITGAYPWLEKIPITSNTWYVANPPMPAILAMPFVLIFGRTFPQEYLAFLVGGGIVALTMLLSLRIKNDKKLAIWSGLLIGFGTIIWFMSSVGSTWYFGQTVACMFLLAALVESYGQRRTWLVGILIGAAYLARINTIVSLPIFLYLLKNKLRIPKNLIFFLLTLGIFIGSDAIYNLARFGVPWNKGYLLIPGVATEPWYAFGVENPAYIGRNLAVVFLSLPKVVDKFPFLIPSWAGLAIWITTPAFIFSLFAKIKNKENIFTWLAVAAVALTVFMHGETGYAQFGYRFAVDFYPFLILLTIKGVSRTGLKWYHWLFLVISIFVNAWGVILINKFHMVSF